MSPSSAWPDGRDLPLRWVPMKARWNVRLLLAPLIMVGYLWEHHRLASMDERFFIRSPGGIRALGLYLLGDYAAAGRAYSALVPASALTSPPRSTGDALVVDRLLAAGLREARAGETGRNVRTMHSVLWLDAEIRGPIGNINASSHHAGDN